jgi:hypothetical protein
MRKHVWKVLGILALPGFAILGFATSLLLTSDSLAGVTTDMPRCSTAALQVIPNFTPATANITSFTVSNIPIGANQCNTLTLAVGWQWGAATNTTGSGVVASSFLQVPMTINTTAITANPIVQLVFHK